MRKNTTGLKQNARLRSQQAMDRAIAALQRMDASDQVINFRTVAAEAKVSTAWLYGQPELRARIMRARGRSDHGAVPGWIDRRLGGISRDSVRYLRNR